MSFQNKSSTSLPFRREKSPDIAPPLRLDEAPPNHRARSNSDQSITRLPSQDRDSVLSDSETGRGEHEILPAGRIGSNPTGSSTPVEDRPAEMCEEASIAHESDDDDGVDQYAHASDETPLPYITPPHGRSRVSHSPFKVGTRLSLSTKTRTSPRKNIWTGVSPQGRAVRSRSAVERVSVGGATVSPQDRTDRTAVRSRSAVERVSLGKRRGAGGPRAEGDKSGQSSDDGVHSKTVKVSCICTVEWTLYTQNAIPY